MRHIKRDGRCGGDGGGVSGEVAIRLWAGSTWRRSAAAFEMTGLVLREIDSTATHMRVRPIILDAALLISRSVIISTRHTGQVSFFSNHSSIQSL